MKVVIKRDGATESFDKSKIKLAIMKAFLEVDGEISQYAKDKAKEIANHIDSLECESLTVEDIQDVVVKKLMASARKDVATRYIEYRYLHKMAREQYNEFFDAISEKLSASNVQNQNANVDEHSFGGRMGEANGVMMRKYALDYIVSPMAKENHLGNMVYIHDLDHYAVGDHNCLSIPFDKLLANGIKFRQVDVRPAKSVNTACQLIAVIMQTQSLQQFG